MDLLTFVRFFLSDEYITLLGNWYPRVLAVLGVVVPVTVLLFTLFAIGITLRCCYFAILGGAK